jgi:GNAT superfamily N-acetyltransferase
VRKARLEDIKFVQGLLREWLPFAPTNNRIESIKYTVAKKELLVAESASEVVGFIHFVIHNDIIDGAPNSFITAFYVTPAYRGIGVGSALLDRALADSARRGATAIETSTISGEARVFYMRRGFKQSRGTIGEIFLEREI